MQLIHGDCLIEMSNISDKSIDMILCDLPYGSTACPWDIIIPFEHLWSHYKRIIKPNRAIALFGSQPFSTHLIKSSPYFGTKKEWFNYELVWDKLRGKGHLVSKYRPLQQTENIYIFGFGPILYNPQMKERCIPRFTVEGKNRTEIMGGKQNENHVGQYLNKRHPTNLIQLSWSPSKVLHSTQKPIALLEYLIRTYTNEGDLVLDNCMGSGSTGIACLNTKRDFIGIELYPLLDRPISKDNPDYFGIAEKRIARHKFEPINDDSKNGHVILF